MVAEVMLSKHANDKLEKELDSMSCKLEEARGDRDEYKMSWNLAVKERADVEISLTRSKAAAKTAKRKTAEVKRLARIKMTEAQ
jgi:hypothetical protein